MFGCGMMKTEKKHFMTKADIFLAAGVIMAALVILFFMNMYRVQGSYARVSYDGAEVYRIPLSGTGTRYYLCTEGDLVRELTKQEWENAALRTAPENGNEDYNIVMCMDGEIRVAEADCPDGICAAHVPVSKTGENIICLPHKLVIEIIGNEGSELDGVVY